MLLKKERTMAMVYKKMKFDEQDSDFAYWQSQSPAKRLEALEQIRSEYMAWKYDPKPRFQRVFSIIRREKS